MKFQEEMKFGLCCLVIFGKRSVSFFRRLESNGFEKVTPTLITLQMHQQVKEN